VGVELGTTPLTGWRLWHLDGTRLTSPQRGDVWPHGRAFEAHYEPGNARCGVNAFCERHQLADFVPAPGVVIGQVSLWGEVATHELGWRAARAYPLVLYATCEADEPSVRDAARAYGATYGGRLSIAWSQQPIMLALAALVGALALLGSGLWQLSIDSDRALGWLLVVTSWLVLRLLWELVHAPARLWLRVQTPKERREAPVDAKLGA
jgi:hypothetical protein